jgi:hypothetical protein
MVSTWPPLKGWSTVGQSFPSKPADPSSNPFIRGSDGSHDITRISRAIQGNPALARKLCRAAGENETIWFGDYGK